jgi:hypothetical protein
MSKSGVRSARTRNTVRRLCMLSTQVVIEILLMLFVGDGIHAWSRILSVNMRD